MTAARRRRAAADCGDTGAGARCGGPVAAGERDVSGAAERREPSSGTDGVAGLQHGPLPSVGVLPTETDLRSTPALLAGVSGLAATGGSPRGALPGVPAFPGEADLKSLLGLGVVGDPLGGAAAPSGVTQPTGFYFLDAPAQAPAAPAAVPAETDVAVPTWSPEVVPATIPAGVSEPDFFDVATVKQRLPHPGRARARQAAGLARQRRHHAEAARGHRSALQLLRARELQRPPRRPRPGGARHRRL